MSDLPGHDHDPDPAALDELRRAFGDEVDRATEPNPVVEPGPAESEVSSELAELGREPTPDPDHEPTPPGLADPTPDPTPESTPVFASEPVAEAVAESAPPKIIRIDGYGGSTEIDPGDTAGLGRHDDHDGDEHDGDEHDGDEHDGDEHDGDEHDHDEHDHDGDERPDAVISIDVDDELPDPVYVEGSLDQDRGGTIVFIENDETGDTLAPESERDMRRGIEPRLRERRVAVKRAQGRRRLKRALLIVGILALVVGGLAVLGSPLFAVREGDVRVFGAQYSSGDRLDAVIDDAVGTPVLRVDTNRLEGDLESIPWIEQARVTTDFPHGLTIDIRERAAVSTYQGPDGRFRVLDRDGRVLDVIDDGYPYAYVLIGGPDAVDLEAGEFAPQGYAAASELAKNLTSSVRGRVVRIEVLADGSRLTLELDDGSAVFFGEARDILAKLVRLEAVLANGEEREPGLIDVSTADVTR